MSRTTKGWRRAKQPRNKEKEDIKLKKKSEVLRGEGMRAGYQYDKEGKHVKRIKKSRTTRIKRRYERTG